MAVTVVEMVEAKEEAWEGAMGVVMAAAMEGALVVALEQGAFKSVNVTVGRIGDKYAEILGGIEPGETVVTSAQFLIDSESSKTSDFQRMSASGSNAMDSQMDHSGHVMDPEKAEPKSEPETMDHSSMNHGGGES